MESVGDKVAVAMDDSGWTTAVVPSCVEVLVVDAGELTDPKEGYGEHDDGELVSTAIVAHGLASGDEASGVYDGCAGEREVAGEVDGPPAKRQKIMV